MLSVAAALETPQVCFCLVGRLTIAQHQTTREAGLSWPDLLVWGGRHRVGHCVAEIELKMMQHIKSSQDFITSLKL